MLALKEADLSFNPIESLEPLSGLPRLASLDLGFVPITDIAPLVSLPNLRTLFLSDRDVYFTPDQIEWYLSLSEVDFYLTESGYIRYVGESMRPQITEMPSTREVVRADLDRLLGATSRVFGFGEDEANWTISHDEQGTQISSGRETCDSDRSLVSANRIAMAGTGILQAPSAAAVVQIAGGCSHYFGATFGEQLSVGTIFGPITVVYSRETGAPESVTILDPSVDWFYEGISVGMPVQDLLSMFEERGAVRSGAEWDPLVGDVLFVDGPEGGADAYFASGDIETRIWFAEGAVRAMRHTRM